MTNVKLPPCRTKAKTIFTKRMPAEKQHNLRLGWGKLAAVGPET
jgi:hypothetical protein